MQYVNGEICSGTTMHTKMYRSPPISSICLSGCKSVRLSFYLSPSLSVCLQTFTLKGPAVYHTSCLSRIPEEIKKRRQGKTSSFEQKPAKKKICGGDGERGSFSIRIVFVQKITNAYLWGLVSYFNFSRTVCLSVCEYCTMHDKHTIMSRKEWCWSCVQPNILTIVEFTIMSMVYLQYCTMNMSCYMNSSSLVQSMFKKNL